MTVRKALEKYKDRVVIGRNARRMRKAHRQRPKNYNTPNKRLLLPGTESVVGLVNIWTDSARHHPPRRYHFLLRPNGKFWRRPNLNPQIAAY